jgi:hypothetical protein
MDCEKCRYWDDEIQECIYEPWSDSPPPKCDLGEYYFGE